MIEFAQAFANELAYLFYEGSIYILVGFAIAGLLHVLLPSDAIAKHLGGNDLRSILAAALLGAPLPLCSCGVVPTAAGLRRDGASKPATLSFLISTPETGVDSIALTYGLLGPFMAVVRPIAAVVTAVAAGIAALVLGVDDRPAESDEAGIQSLDAGCTDDVCETQHMDGEGSEDESGSKLSRAFRYAFQVLLDDLAFWIVFGFVLTALIASLLPDEFFSLTLGWNSGIVPMLLMVGAGIPLYLCASASTPIAAALIAKGLSPGAALVFLLAGPATNAATMTVVAKMLGKKHLQIYLASIIIVSLGAGLLVDAWAAPEFAENFLDKTRSDSFWFSTLKTLAAVVLAILLVTSLSRTRAREARADLANQFQNLRGQLSHLEARDIFNARILVPLALLAFAALASSMMLVVEPGQSGIVRSFGKIRAAGLEPGLHLHGPWPIAKGITVDVDRAREVTVGFRGTSQGMRSGILEQAYYLTGDENVIDLRSVAYYRASDANLFAFGVEKTDDIVRAAAQQALVATVGQSPIDTIYTTDRDTIEAKVREKLADRIRAQGIGCEVLDFRFLDVHAPADVHDAFRDVASALEDQQQIIHTAGAFAAETAAEADGDAAAALAEAEGAAKLTKANASGNTATFADLAAVYKNSRETTALRLYLESLETALPDSFKLVTPDSESVDTIDLWLGRDARGSGTESEQDIDNERSPVDFLGRPNIVPMNERAGSARPTQSADPLRQGGNSP